MRITCVYIIEILTDFKAGGPESQVMLSESQGVLSTSEAYASGKDPAEHTTHPFNTMPYGM